MSTKILFIGGSLNQTSMMHQIARQFNPEDCWFSPCYADGAMDFLVKKGWLNFTILGGKFRQQNEEYFIRNLLRIDYKGLLNRYDLVFIGQDLMVPRNVRFNRLVLVQEGMTNPENIFFYLAKYAGIPRWLADTAAFGLSDLYQLFFVASEGYKELFIRKGVKPHKIHVTGIPNFDHARQYLVNKLPYRHYVLAATSDRRETLGFENRRKFIEKVLDIAGGRQVIFKLHPNENWPRATMEIQKQAPKAMVFCKANINHLIANCDVLVTKYSSVVYTGIALGKKVYSDFDLNMLRRLAPIQNEGTSAIEISRITKKLLLSEIPETDSYLNPELVARY